MKALEVNGVSKRFPGMEKLALNRVCLLYTSPSPRDTR
mgnify:CR=1 FL=1